MVEMIREDTEAGQRFSAALHGVDFKASGSANASGTLRNSHTRMTERIRTRAGR